MKKALIKTVVCCAACSILAIPALAQTATGSPGTRDLTSPKDRDIELTTPAARNQDTELSATGRQAQHQKKALRASKVIGAEVKSQTGERIGRIEDVVLNPQTRQIDLAVISMTGMGTSPGTTPGTTPGTGGTFEQPGTGTGAGATGGPGATGGAPGAGQTGTTPGSPGYGATASQVGKLIPVPFALLKADPDQQQVTPGMQQHQQYTFTLNVDRAKLQQAPSFDRANWPDISQQDWRQRVFSHYGLSPDSPVGAAETPGGQIEQDEDEDEDRQDRQDQPDTNR
jgi:hypothetical protein